MKLDEVPEQFRRYTILMSDRSEYNIDGLTKDRIMHAPGNFIQLQNGTVINKSFITQIRLNKEETRTYVIDHQEEIKKALVKV